MLTEQLFNALLAQLQQENAALHRENATLAATARAFEGAATNLAGDVAQLQDENVDLRLQVRLLDRLLSLQLEKIARMQAQAETERMRAEDYEGLLATLLAIPGVRGALMRHVAEYLARPASEGPEITTPVDAASVTSDAGLNHHLGPNAIFAALRTVSQAPAAAPAVVPGAAADHDTAGQASDAPSSAPRYGYSSPV